LQEDSSDTNSVKGAIIFLSKNEQKENPVIFVVMQTNKNDKLYQYFDLVTKRKIIYRSFIVAKYYRR
jgi:hypothetical protein